MKVLILNASLCVWAGSPIQGFFVEWTLETRTTEHVVSCSSVRREAPEVTTLLSQPSCHWTIDISLLTTRQYPSIGVDGKKPVQSDMINEFFASQAW